MIAPFTACLTTSILLLILGRKAVAPSSHKTKTSLALSSQFNPMELQSFKGHISEAYQRSAVLQLGGELREPYPPDWPMIDRYHTANVTALAGETTSLNCRVHRLGNRSVSWLKRDTIHLLTVGRYTYTSDLRFEGKHVAGSLDWSLLLRDATPSDSGEYDCQVSTTPPIAVTIFLNVKESETVILGAPEVYVQVGSTINLTCVVSNTARPPLKVEWEKDGQLLSYLGPRPGVSLVTDKAERTVVSLIMAEAKLNDSGSYFCQPFSRNMTEDLPIANISVHVIRGANIDQLSGVDCPRTLSKFLLMIAVNLIGIDLIKAAEKMLLVVRELQRKIPNRPNVGGL